MKFKDEREEEITEEDTEWKEILKHIRSSISGSKGNVFKVEHNMNENEEDEFAMQRDLEKRRCRLYDGTSLFFLVCLNHNTLLLVFIVSIRYIYIYISIHSGTHRIMRRRTTSSNKERPDLRQEESSEEEKDEEEENRKIMYEVTIPHGILIGEVWIEYGELVRGIKEDNVSKKVYVEANEGKSKGWVDRNGLTAAAVINKPL